MDNFQYNYKIIKTKSSKLQHVDTESHVDRQIDRLLAVSIAALVAYVTSNNNQTKPENAGKDKKGYLKEVVLTFIAALITFASVTVTTKINRKAELNEKKSKEMTDITVNVMKALDNRPALALSIYKSYFPYDSAAYAINSIKFLEAREAWHVQKGNYYDALHRLFGEEVATSFKAASDKTISYNEEIINIMKSNKQRDTVVNEEFHNTMELISKFRDLLRAKNSEIKEELKKDWI